MIALIDPNSVRQAGLGEVVPQHPTLTRTSDLVRALVLRVYPVGHPNNKLGQTVVDVQPLAELPILYGVPIALGHAHQETERAVPYSTRRLPYDPKPRNRVEGSWHDLRPGTHVWLQFVGGSLYDPLVVGTANFDGGGAAFPVERQHVDRLTPDGDLVALEDNPATHARDSAMSEYPRASHVINGTRIEVDNRGNLYIQTTIDRTPGFLGHNGIPASPDPEGSIGVSTRGAPVGNVIFTTGKHPRTGDPSRGRQGRRTLEAEEGTICDETHGSKIGNVIKRIASQVGRFWLSTVGSGDGRVYLEAKDREYLALGRALAELAADTVVLDGGTVKLGSGEAASPLVLWPQLDALVQQIMQKIDQHKHLGVTPGTGTTGVPESPTFQSTWAGGAPSCKAADVFADPENAPSPEPQDDPE